MLKYPRAVLSISKLLSRCLGFFAKANDAVQDITEIKVALTSQMNRFVVFFSSIIDIFTVSLSLIFIKKIKYCFRHGIGKGNICQVIDLKTKKKKLQLSSWASKKPLRNISEDQERNM